MGLDATAPDPSSELIELSESKPVGIFNQNRVDTGNVEPAFHDGGAEHDVGFSTVERHHRALQLPFGHLSMGDEELKARKHLPKLAGDLVNPFHTRHHIKHLTTTIKFLANGAAHCLVIQGRQVSFDRPSQGWWGGNQTHFTHPRQTHIKGSRDRRR